MREIIEMARRDSMVYRDIQTIYPLTRWAIWHRYTPFTVLASKTMEFADMASGFVGQTGGHVAFEIYDDAVLWLVFWVYVVV